MKKILLGLVLLALVSCASGEILTSSDLQKKTDEANLFFTRPAKGFAAFIGIPVSIDEKKVFTLSIGSSDKYSLKPGNYQIKSGYGGLMRGGYTYEISVEASKNYFFIIDGVQQTQTSIIIETSEEGYKNNEEDKSFTANKNLEKEKKLQAKIEIERKGEEDKRKQEASARLKQTLIELEKIYSDKCKNLTRGSDQYKNCLLEQDKIVKQTEAKKLLAKQEEERRILNAELVKKKELENKLQEEKIKISKMAPDDRRAYTCSDKFGFRKGSDKFKDCVFKIYAAEIEMEKLELQRDLARANAETARLRAEAARASDDRQERLLQAQTETAKMQALAARQPAIAANTAESLALMESGLRMMSPQQSAPRMQTTCTYVGRFLNCY